MPRSVSHPVPNFPGAEVTEANRTEDPKCYIGRCVCGGIVFACVDDPKHTDDTAKAVAECLRDGFPIERVELDVARNGTWCTTSKECRNPPKPKSQVEMTL